MHPKFLFVVLLLVAACVVSNCGPSPEQIATKTAAAWTPTPTIPVVTCAGAPDPSAQKMTLIIQTRSGENVAGGGVIIASGGSVSFGPNGESTSAGFWESINDGKYTVKFSDPDGKTSNLVELQGPVSWDQTQCIVNGADSFIRIMVVQDVWMNITKREVKQGRLVLTDEKGNKYVVLAFGAQFYGEMIKQ